MLKVPPPASMGGGMLVKRRFFDTKIPIKGRAGVGKENIHQISPNRIKIRLEFRCNLSYLRFPSRKRFNHSSTSCAESFLSAASAFGADFIAALSSFTKDSEDMNSARFICAAF